MTSLPRGRRVSQRIGAHRRGGGPQGGCEGEGAEGRGPAGGPLRCRRARLPDPRLRGRGGLGGRVILTAFRAGKVPQSGSMYRARMERRHDILLTPRTVMRPFETHDAVDAFAVFGDPVVMRYAAGAPDASVDATRTRLERYANHQATYGFSKWAVRAAITGQYLGDAGILHLPDTGEPELGYRLACAYWGQGLATEIAGAWLRHAIDVLRLPRVIAFADHHNEASIRVLHKIGMPFERNDHLCGIDCVVHAFDARTLVEHR